MNKEKTITMPLSEYETFQAEQAKFNVALSKLEDDPDKVLCIEKGWYGSGYQLDDKNHFINKFLMDHSISELREMKRNLRKNIKEKE